jgi:xanthine dehydrogenase YagT iron-sulfur-binding subunit
VGIRPAADRGVHGLVPYGQQRTRDDYTPMRSPGASRHAVHTDKDVSPHDGRRVTGPDGTSPGCRNRPVPVIWSNHAVSGHDANQLLGGGRAMRTQGPSQSPRWHQQDCGNTKGGSAMAFGVDSPTDQRVSQAEFTLHVNGEEHAVRVDTRVTLLDVLRDRLGLTGTKKGCDQGACGACTVHVDGKRVLSCLTLAAQCQDRQVTTIEGVGDEETPHPLQSAFLQHDGFQCGYCTPGQIMSALALLEEGRAGSADEIREYMSGNICRCGAYQNIVSAIQQVAGDRGATL